MAISDMVVICMSRLALFLADFARSLRLHVTVIANIMNTTIGLRRTFVSAATGWTYEDSLLVMFGSLMNIEGRLLRERLVAKLALEREIPLMGNHVIVHGRLIVLDFAALDALETTVIQLLVGKRHACYLPRRPAGSFNFCEPPRRDKNCLMTSGISNFLRLTATAAQGTPIATI
jgi:hypothetical protein